ncbi:hypothetical protein HHK36_009627 [Tetracentron sinense]|uniref:Pyruvate phosphate dikinase AMP/ATP-binding domain-containing protein n=1 Tax=Tetracentron sinense TaxID=13715 RepID=A0A834ZGI7_TETSI|nr:hypothetical protein HHK36_009627 [Tetracentron sinense]
MACSRSTNHSQVPLVHRFELGEGMQLQVNVSGSSNGRDAKVELQLRNCSRTWILHWGGTYRGQMNWVIPDDLPSGTRSYKQTALQTPFMKQDYEDALRELQSQLSKGISLDELQNTSQAASAKKTADNKKRHILVNSPTSSIYHRRLDVSQWLHKPFKGHAKGSGLRESALLDLVEKSMGGDNVILRQNFHVGDHEIAVLLKIVRGDYQILVAVNMKGATVLHWGLLKLTSGEWLAPPPEMLPERSKLLDRACQTYFKDMQTGEGFFQFVHINLQQSDFVGISFVLWSGGSWIKNNGSNFSIGLKPMNPKCRKGEGDGKGIVKWLLDEISQREKEAERSLMHRFNIATELTERCKSEGELGLIGILVWLRFMACRQLTWNKNYNVKPREISAAQDKFTNLLQTIYSSQPNDREIVRLIMTSIGRGGQGDVGQRIRDDILVLQVYRYIYILICECAYIYITFLHKNNDCKGGMMEEWHQKLHNNSSPDDVIICQALLDYVRSDFKIDVYWRTLNANGLTKGMLASYDRPIVSEPRFRADTKEGLTRDLISYLRTLKAVHSGIDLESAIENCMGYSSKGHNFMNGIQVSSVGGLSLRLQGCLNFVKMHIDDRNIIPLMEKLLGARIELHPILLTSHGRLKDLLFLDLALASAIRTTMERGFKDLNNAQLPDILFFFSLMLENLCLSTVNNEDFIYCTKFHCSLDFLSQIVGLMLLPKDWYRICESYKPNDEQWALQTKAVLDRTRMALADKSQYYQKMIQPSAQYLGDLLGVEKWAVDIFTEELTRAGAAASLSMLINRLDPILRKIANLGCWQIISSVEVCGFLNAVNEFITIQNKVYKKPTIIVANRVSGEEEIPDGVVAVLTPDTPDVLSHVSIRARNSKVCFATCFDQSILRDLKSKEGKAISIRLKSTSLIISDISSSEISSGPFVSSSLPRGVTLKKKSFGGKYAVSAEEFTSDMVGAKSRNIQFLRGRIPSWINIPTSVALPFGVFEIIMSEDLNKDLANKVSSFGRLVHGGDLSKLRAIQETILQIKAPAQLVYELKIKMKCSRMTWPGDEGEERWKQAWQAIKKVWASKWNERAYVSCKKANLNHDNLCMAVLVQEIISADYAFVIHTKNPLSGDTSEIYTEVIGYPSKQIGLFIKRSLIFRSDSNGEDLEGYAGAGLYDSVCMDKEEEAVLDYSCDRLIVDKGFQLSLFSKIAEVGKIIEGVYHSAQDIEGVVKNGEVYVVQTRPQI